MERRVRCVRRVRRPQRLGCERGAGLERVGRGRAREPRVRAPLRLLARGPRCLGDRAPGRRLRAPGSLRRDPRPARRRGASRAAGEARRPERGERLVVAPARLLALARRVTHRAAAGEPRVRLGSAKRRRPRPRRCRGARRSLRSRRSGNALDRGSPRGVARAGDGAAASALHARVERARGPRLGAGTRARREHVLVRGPGRRVSLARARPRDRRASAVVWPSTSRESTTLPRAA